LTGLTLGRSAPAQAQEMKDKSITQQLPDPCIIFSWLFSLIQYLQLLRFNFFEAGFHPHQFERRIKQQKKCRRSAVWILSRITNRWAFQVGFSGKTG
jgi:hypothetical protein